MHALTPHPSSLETIRKAITEGLRKKGYATDHARNGQLWIGPLQMSKAPPGLRFPPAKYVGGAQKVMHPNPRGVFRDRLFEPMTCLRMMANVEMRTTNPDKTVKCQRIVSREIERNQEPLHG